jgi:thiol-disulfide isomerase/thioredoxin
LVKECRELLDRQSKARQEGDAAFQEFRRLHPGFIEDDFSTRFLNLAQAHPRDPIAFDALVWVAVFGFRTEAAEPAATILARDHSRDPRLWEACQEMTRGPICPARGILLRAIFRDNPDRNLRGRAGLALVQHLLDEAQFVRLARTTGPGPYQARFFSKERMDQFRKLDDDAMDREAEETSERVIRDYSDVRPVTLVRSPFMDWDARMIYRSPQDTEAPKGTVGDLARSRLDEIRSLAISKPAPEIDGENDLGKLMKLADFRGKVVLLTFSGDWCGPCVAMYPHERDLVKRFAGRPFELLSVNTNAKREELLKTIAAGTITWRCWWEPLGDGSGPLADRWHIRAWPTIFAIDHRGILRAKSNGTLDSKDQFETGLDETLEALIKEAEMAVR